MRSLASSPDSVATQRAGLVLPPLIADAASVGLPTPAMSLHGEIGDVTEIATHRAQVQWRSSLTASLAGVL